MVRTSSMRRAESNGASGKGSIDPGPEGESGAWRVFDVAGVAEAGFEILDSIERGVPGIDRNVHRRGQEDGKGGAAGAKVDRSGTSMLRAGLAVRVTVGRTVCEVRVLQEMQGVLEQLPDAGEKDTE